MPLPRFVCLVAHNATGSSVGSSEAPGTAFSLAVNRAKLCFMGAYEQALKPMADMLAADGYELKIADENAPSRLEITVVATADACEECLVPKELFASITAKYLQDNGLKADLTIIYPTDH